VLSAEELDGYIHFARSYKEVQSSVDEDDTTSQTITESTFFSLGGDAASSATSFTYDPHAVSKAEAQSYYAGLPSEPTLIYRTGKELCEVFTHPIAKVWNHDLGWKVVKIMDTHTVN
jgi:hypothetical protein